MYEKSMRKSRNKRNSAENKKISYKWIIILAIGTCILLLLAYLIHHFHLRYNKRDQKIEKLSLINNFTKIYEKEKIKDFYNNNFVINEILIREDLSYTQGLFFYNKNLYESGGLFSKSFFGKREKNNKLFFLKEMIKLKSDYFGQGADFLEQNGEVFFYQLTWKNKKILKINKKFEKIEEIDLSEEIKEGWGITHNPEFPNIFFISNGTNIIFECDSQKNFEIIKKHEILFENGKMEDLNELEYIKGKIWANFYLSNKIMIIDLNLDQVVKIIDFIKLADINDKAFHLLHDRYIKPGECFNGIAYDEDSDSVILTGKNWPLFFNVTVSFY